MLLTKVTIHKYKSFLTEQTYVVEPRITRIVGKNESGKTALLEALAKTRYFEKNAEFTFNKDLDYPRSGLVKVRSTNPEVITCYYELTATEKQAIDTSFTAGAIEVSQLVITTYYDNTTNVSGITVNWGAFKSWIAALDDIDEEIKAAIDAASSFDELLTAVNPNAILRNRLSEFPKQVVHGLDRIESYVFKTFLESKIPQFWYFSDYFSLPSRINLTDFAANRTNGELTDDGLKIAKALFELSGLEVADVQSEANFEYFKAQLEATSNAITDDMFEYWSTNENLEIRFDIEHAGNNVRYLNIRIYNTKHRVTLPLKNRSKGFLWFFSFLVWFSKIQGKKDTNYILLLDEPGLSLHASAQNDLLRFIEEKLAPEYQVLYTTHSPFMIDSLKLNEVRTVYDTQDSKVGSVVSDALEERDSDTLFPLQAALGYTIAQNLYVSPKNLLVEGISDLVYLNHFSALLKSLGRTGLNDDITIVPVGGADKIATFISLMRGNDLDSVCLLDTFTDQKAKTRLLSMVEKKIIADKKIVFYHDSLGVAFADIEDIFSIEEYLALYNGAFGKSIDLSQINPDKPIMAQLKYLNGNNSFNHYSPANYMAKNIGALEFSTETLDRFETLFTLVNGKFQ